MGSTTKKRVEQEMKVLSRDKWRKATRESMEKLLGMDGHDSSPRASLKIASASARVWCWEAALSHACCLNRCVVPEVNPQPKHVARLDHAGSTVDAAMRLSL